MKTVLCILSIGALLAFPGFGLPVLAQGAPPSFTPPRQQMMPQPRTPFDTAGRLASQVLDQEDTIMQLRQQMSALASQETERAKHEADVASWWADWWKAAMQAPHPAIAPAPVTAPPSAAAAAPHPAPMTPPPAAPSTPVPSAAERPHGAEAVPGGVGSGR